jgi:Kef-type K+ transport system membrane component KefB
MPPARSPVSARTAIAYALMIGGAVAAFAWICHLGAGLPAATPAAPPSAGLASGPRPDLLPRLLLALLAVIATARVMAALFQRLHQPPVIGEVIAGIVLGPSLLGRVAPEVAAFVFPAAVVPHIGMLSQVGVILFMFLVGVHLDTGLLGQRRHAVVAISHASIVVPFVLGAALALLLYPRLSRGDVPFATFALFVGVAMSITAFPVLARILRDRGIQNTPIGVLAISCAAVDDVTAWCLLALLIAVARQEAGAFLLTAALVVAYVAFMLAVVRPALRRLVARVETSEEARPIAVAMLLVGVVASALATEAIGIHALFGAFFLGALIPNESKLAQELSARVEDVVLVLLLPAFFAVTGLRTQMGLLQTAEQWLLCLAILAVACLGKIGGAMAAARATGLPWRESAALGALMNTRGLMELIVLNVGLDLGLISPTLFTMMVFMAVFTSLATAPLLSALKVGSASVRSPS